VLIITPLIVISDPSTKSAATIGNAADEGSAGMETSFAAKGIYLYLRNTKPVELTAHFQTPKYSQVLPV
jgi:hypothetical protein